MSAIISTLIGMIHCYVTIATLLIASTATSDAPLSTVLQRREVAGINLNIVPRIPCHI